MPNRIQPALLRTLCLVALVLAIAPVTAALAQSKQADKPKTEESGAESQALRLPAALMAREAPVEAHPTRDETLVQSRSLAHATETILFPEVDVALMRPQEADSTVAEPLDVGDALIGAIFFAVASLWISLR